MAHDDAGHLKSLAHGHTPLRIRFFSSASDDARARRPTDAVLLFLAMATIGFAAFASEDGPLGSAISAFFQALPGLAGWLLEICDTLIVVWALVLVCSAVVGHGRLNLLRDQLLAVAFAAGCGALLVSEGASLFDGLTASGPQPIDPAVRIALATAVIATAAPHLGRPVRRIGRWLIPLASLSAIALAIATPLGVVVGLALGYGSAALVHVIFGSPGGRPTLTEVSDALADLGVHIEGMRPAGLAQRGVALMEASSTDGRAFRVKVYGRDAWDGQLLNVVWSYLWFRDETPNLTISRLQQVEHEAFLTLLAERAGVPVESVVAAGMAEDDALLVTEARGPWLADVDDDAITDRSILELWRSVVLMHDGGIAHGILDANHVGLLPDGTIVIGGFAGASAAASSAHKGADRAQLLVLTALLAGPARAIDAALAGIGPDGLASALPFLQSAALSRATRKALKASDTSLDALRAQVAAATGTDAPKLEPLRRLSWGSVLRLVLLVLAAWAIIPTLLDVSLESLVAQLESAQAAWLWTALLVSPLVQVAEAFSTLGACPLPLRLGPTIGLQFAIRFIALTVPSSAGRIALNVRYFQREGLAASPAVVIGVVDSVAGFVVQMLLLIVIWLAGLVTLQISTEGLPLDLSAGTVLAIAIALVIGLVILIIVPRVRRAIRPRLREATEALRVVKSPSKVFELFVGNLASQVILAIVLGMCVRAFGYQVNLAEAILVNTLASLFSGLVPVPGGIGVMETAITAGLVAVGIPESAAVAAAILYRMITFYLPPIWGAYAMREMKRREYL